MNFLEIILISLVGLALLTTTIRFIKFVRRPEFAYTPYKMTRTSLVIMFFVLVIMIFTIISVILYHMRWEMLQNGIVVYSALVANSAALIFAIILAIDEKR